MKYNKVIKSVMPLFEPSWLNIPFRDVGIDSMDLVTLRVKFEKIIDKEIREKDWQKFQQLNDIITYCNIYTVKQKNLLNQSFIKPITIDYSLNMPNMANEALSENWLFKELGDIHWKLISKGLNIQSNNVKDELNNRLYASFVRIRISLSPLYKFKENDRFSFFGNIKRYGKSTYYSDIQSNKKSNKKYIKANLMSSFIYRNMDDNTQLLKSQPKTKRNLIQEFNSIPTFGSEYQLIKKGFLNKIKLDNFTFQVTSNFIYSTKYIINPFYDINGVGLLYFAAYPTINDFCEAKYFNSKNITNKRWETIFHTKARDVFYYANCNINDVIVYKLNYYKFYENKIKLLSSLYRVKDNVLLAQILTINGNVALIGLLL